MNQKENFLKWQPEKYSSSQNHLLTFNHFGEERCLFTCSPDWHLVTRLSCLLSNVNEYRCTPFPVADLHVTLKSDMQIQFWVTRVDVVNTDFSVFIWFKGMYPEDGFLPTL